MSAYFDEDYFSPDYFDASVDWDVPGTVGSSADMVGTVTGSSEAGTVAADADLTGVVS